MTDELDEEEARWVKRIKRVINDMPASLELQVHHDTISVLARGTWASMGEGGTADNLDELDSFKSRHVYPCSESL